MLKHIKKKILKFLKSTKTEYPIITRILGELYGQNMVEFPVDNLSQMLNFLRVINVYIQHNYISVFDTRKLSFELEKLDTYFDLSKENYDILTKANNKNDICTVCLDDNVDSTTKCGHSYHLECILEWHERNPTCPTCRAVL